MTFMAKTIKETVLAGKLDMRLRLLLTAGTKEEAESSLDVALVALRHWGASFYPLNSNAVRLNTPRNPTASSEVLTRKRD